MARVLVVGSPDHARKALIGQLRRLGHKTETADSVLVALERVRQLPLDLLALDYGVLGMAGLTQVREVLAALGDPRPAVLLMTASPIGEVAAHVTHAAGVGLIQKPFEFGELAQAVRALLSAA